MYRPAEPMSDDEIGGEKAIGLLLGRWLAENATDHDQTLTTTEHRAGSIDHSTTDQRSVLLLGEEGDTASDGSHRRTGSVAGRECPADERGTAMSNERCLSQMLALTISQKAQVDTMRANRERGITARSSETSKAQLSACVERAGKLEGLLQQLEGHKQRLQTPTVGLMEEAYGGLRIQEQVGESVGSAEQSEGMTLTDGGATHVEALAVLLTLTNADRQRESVQRLMRWWGRDV